MQNFFCQMARNAKSTFKEKYFIYEVDRGEGSLPTKPTDAATKPADAATKPADAATKPADAPARREGEGDEARAERTEAENPQSMFEALKGKVASLDSTIGKVIGNETYTKGLQQEAAQAKQALAQIQATMRTVNIEKVDMEALRAFEGQLTTLEGRTGKFQGEEEAANIAAKAKITTLRASLDKAAKEEYNGAKLKETILKNLESKKLTPEIKAAIEAQVDKANFGPMMEHFIKMYQLLLNNSDVATGNMAIAAGTSGVGRALDSGFFTTDHIMKNAPAVIEFNTRMTKILDARSRTLAQIEAGNDTKAEDKATLKALSDKLAVEAINGKREYNEGNLLASPLHPLIDGLTDAGKALYDEIFGGGKAKETAEAKELREKRASITSMIARADTMIAQLKPAHDDKGAKIYTQGLVEKSVLATTNTLATQATLSAAKSGDDATLKATDASILDPAEAQIKAVEDDPALKAEAMDANKASKAKLNALTTQATEKETAMTPDQLKADIFAERDIASLPEPLQKALEARFPKDAVTADLAAKFAAIKEKLSAADNLADITSLETVLDEINQYITDFTVETYCSEMTVSREIFGDFTAAANRAALWNELKGLGDDGEQCKAAKAKVLEELVKAITENGDFSLDEADHQILGAFVADVVSEKIKKPVTPEQITGTIMTFRGISKPSKLDKNTQAILQALNSPELKGKVNLDWTASTNATPHEVAKTLAEHEEMLSGLDEYEEREAKGTIKVDNTNNSPELDGAGKPINQPGTFDKELVVEYRKLVEDAKNTKGTPQYKAAMKALREFTKDNEGTLCAAGGHFDMATAIVRARCLRKLVHGKDAGVDVTNETVKITLTNRPEDKGKSELKSAGLSFSAPVKEGPPAEEEPVAKEEEAPAEEAPAADAEPAPDAESPPVAGEPPAAAEGEEEAPGGEAPPAAEAKPPAPAASAVGVPGFDDSAPNPDGGRLDPGFNEKALIPDSASHDTFGAEKPPATADQDSNSPGDKWVSAIAGQDSKSPEYKLAQEQAIIDESNKITTWHTKPENDNLVDYSFEGREPKEGDFRKIDNDNYDTLEKFHDGKWSQGIIVAKTPQEGIPDLKGGIVTDAGSEKDTSGKIPDGRGKRDLPNGTVEEGIFKDNQLVEGTISRPDKAIVKEEGTFKNGSLVKGKKTWSLGAIVEGTFDEEENLVKGKTINADGSIEEVGI